MFDTPEQVKEATDKAIAEIFEQFPLDREYDANDLNKLWEMDKTLYDKLHTEELTYEEEMETRIRRRALADRIQSMQYEAMERN